MTTTSLRTTNLVLVAGVGRQSADEVAAIDALDTGVRGGPDQDAVDFRTFGVTIPE